MVRPNAETAAAVLVQRLPRQLRSPSGSHRRRQLGCWAVAPGIASSFRLWRVVRLDRDVRPVFVVVPEFAACLKISYLRRGFSTTGGRSSRRQASLIRSARRRHDPGAARHVKSPRLVVASTTTGRHVDMIGSREVPKCEATGIAGGVIRGDSDQFRVSDGVTWGLGAQFPSRSRLRAMIEWQGEFVIERFTEVINPPYRGEDGSVAPVFSPISDPTNFKFGAVWNAPPAFRACGVTTAPARIPHGGRPGDRPQRLVVSTSASAGTPA